MSATSYVVGHDVGTSGNKAVLCDMRGRIVGTTHESYAVHQPRPGWAEQDVEELVAAVSRATRRLLAENDVAAEQILALGVSGQMFCVAAVDEHGIPLSPLLSWLDMRSTEHATKIAQAFPGDQYERFGSVFTAKDIVPKILWLCAEAPGVARRAAAYVDCKDAVAARLTGRVATDHAGASAYLLYDLARHEWKTEAAASLGVLADRLPPALDATAELGGLTPGAAGAAGLLAGTPVVVGAGDVPAGQVGSGAARPGQGHLSLGTASYFGISLDDPVADPGRRLALLGHVDRGRSLLWAEMETGAGALAWWRRTIGIDDPEEVDRLAASVDDTAADVPLFAPWLTGERVPYWDDDARGAFVGLSYRHGAAELTRAVIEGICFQLRLVFEYAVAFGVDPDEIRVVGGAGMGGVLPAVLADVLDRGLLLVDGAQSAGARGAAFCALIACDGTSLDDLSDAVGVTRTIRPVHGLEPYAARLERFRQLHAALAPLAK